jgi:anti-sigma-K factor RskA
VNAQDYISSGLLEAYLLGGLSVGESEQVAGAVCRFPEVAAELARMEADLLHAAEEDAVTPPPGLDDKIWAAIKESGAANTSQAAPAPISDPVSQPYVPKQTTRVIPLGNAAHPAQSWLRAATWITLAGSMVANIALWSGRSTDRSQIALLEQQTTELSTKQKELVASLGRYWNEADMMAQPGMHPVPMLSTQPGHPMAATMYWDKAKSEAYVSVQKLPPPPSGMQYQLWAIADGKPVDLGMLENNVAMQGGMQKVPKAVTAGQAFAVSLEKEGGNPTPTADKIFLLGKMPEA